MCVPKDPYTSFKIEIQITYVFVIELKYNDGNKEPGILANAVL